MNATMIQTQKLPLHDQHASLGAKFMEFAGWTVPLQYTTIVEEHLAVRQKAGVFDVSHMGKFLIRGENALDYLETVLSNGLKKISPEKALYGLLLNENGGVIDDVIVYEMDRSRFFMIVNASMREKDFHWLESHRPEGVELVNESSSKTILAVQGPRSEGLLAKLFSFDFKDLKPFHFKILQAFGTDVFVGATGYTGERGFEIVNLKEKTQEIFSKLLIIGKEFGLQPAGFGARDTLRLEAKYLLNGQDMDEEITPLEATLEWVLDFSKDFIGKEALLKQMDQGLSRRLVGFEMVGSGIARHGHEIFEDGRKIGTVTSGTFSPTLQKAIGLGYLPLEYAAAGTEFLIRIRERDVPARVVKTPFYKKKAVSE